MRAAIRHGIHQQGKPFRVMRGQPIEPRMQAVERFSMRRQHKSVFGKGAKALKGCQKGAERISSRFARMQADLGRNARQDLISGDQHAGLRIEQAGHIRRMALAGHHLPGLPANA